MKAGSRSGSGNRLTMLARIWILLFIVISIACFAVLFSVIRTNENAIQSLQESHGKILVDQVIDVEDFINGFETMGNKLSENSDLLEIASRTSVSKSDPQVEKVLSQVLNIYNWNATRPYRQLAFVYLPNNGLLLDVISQIAFSDSDDLLERINMSKQSWDQFLNVDEQILVDTIWDGDMDFARLMIAQKIADDIVLITGIGASDMADILKTSQLPTGSQIMLLTKSNQAITYADEQTKIFECPYTWEELQDLPDVSTETIGDVSYYQYHISMLDGVLHQLAFVPVETYGIISVQKLFLIFLLIWILGIPFAFLLSKLIYHPVQKMMDRLSVFPQDHAEKEDEITFIEKTIRSLEAKTQSYQSQLNSQKKQFYDFMILRAIKGQYKVNETFLKACQEMGMEQAKENERILLAAVRMENFELHTNAQGILESYMDMDVQKKKYEQEFQNIPHFFLKDERMLIGILKFPKDDLKEIINRLDQVRKKVENGGKFTSSILISSSFYHLEDLSKAYNQILELLHDMDWSGQYDVLLDYHTFIKENKKIKEQEDLPKLIQRMEETVQNGEFYTAKKIVQTICTQIASATQHFSGQTSIEATFTAVSLFRALEQYRNSAQKENIVISSEQLEKWQSLNSVYSVSGLQKQAEEILNEMTEYETVKDDSESHIRMAVAYIQEHYKDPELSASTVAQIANMMPSAFSKAFKQSTGIAYLEYIHRLRIDAAKKLLAKGQMNLKEIAEQVGYTNTVTMNRAFKRYENTTPGKLR